MNTIEKICKKANVMYSEHDQHGLKFMLIDGKVVFEDDFLHHPFCRDMMIKVYVDYCGMDVDNYYKSVFNTLDKELR